MKVTLWNSTIYLYKRINILYITTYTYKRKTNWRINAEPKPSPNRILKLFNAYFFPVTSCHIINNIIAVNFQVNNFIIFYRWLYWGYVTLEPSIEKLWNGSARLMHLCCPALSVPIFLTIQKQHFWKQIVLNLPISFITWFSKPYI